MKPFQHSLTPLLIVIFSALLIAGNCNKPSTVEMKTCWDGSKIPVTQDCPPQVDTEKPVISNFTVSGVTSTSAVFNYSATDNKAVTSLTLTVVSTVDVTGTSSKTVEGLAPSTSYTATLTAKDAAENTTTATVTFVTAAPPVTASTWLSAPQVSYGTQFSIEQNAVSNKLTVTINNSAASTKTATSLIASFGSAGSAVKMLRYQLNGASTWNTLSITNGSVNFGGINLQPGVNTFVCYFAIKVNAGVANGSALSFSFTSLDDGSGANAPLGGAFQSTVAVGTVNSVTQATVLTTEWAGVMLTPGIVLTQNATARDPLYNVANVRATGPAGARIVSLKLKNPYFAFSGLTFDNSTWTISNGSVFGYINNYLWQNEYVTFSLPNENYCILNTNGTTYNEYYVNCTYKNTSTITFNSNDYTFGREGFALTSKYDIVIQNADGQVVDLSEVTVKQDGVTIQ